MPILPDRLLLSQWSNNLYCEGPPNMMYVFPINDFASYEPDEGETWSTYYTLLTADGDSGINRCGTTMKSMHSNCCFSTLSLEYLDYWSSGSPALLDPSVSDYNTSVYASTAGYSYCTVQSINSSLFDGYESTMVLGDDNCTDKHYKCSSDGLFRIYTEENCEGSSVDFTLTTEQTEYTDSEIGDFVGFINSFNSGTQKVEWVAYAPSAYLVPLNPPNNRFITWDIFSIVEFVICLCFYFGASMYGITRYYRSPKRYLMYLTINQILWFVQQWIHFYIYMTVFKEYDEYNLVMAIHKPLRAFTTLTTVLLTTYQLYYSPVIPQKSKPLVYSFVVLLHLSISGSEYFEWCYFTSFSDWTVCNSIYLENWRNIQYLWIVIMYVWNIIPTILMAFVIINTTGLVQTTGIGSFIISAMRILTQSHRIFVGLVISQILLMAFYFIWSNILIYYQFLGSDKVVLSLSISLSVFCALHIVINLGLLECLPKIFKLASNNNTATFPKSTMSQQMKKM